MLHQFLSNQTGYQQTLATAMQSAIQNFPADLATVPAAIQNLLSGDPAAALQTIINQQMGYAQTINTALHSAAQDFGIGVAGLHDTFKPPSRTSRPATSTVRWATSRPACATSS
ncbi:hypothetical protein C3473_13065 [Mycobacterium kansasii]|uniref:hypothetical protein n=1 Tax=Mycobacterium TaxID=1763 RepID=UPI0007B4FE15|nr:MULTISPECIES: hypothetical protein [Mycobacterium]KZS68036.1 hypothetical protein A4G27_07110 [Mycobacterium kansasii]ORC10683.1 hypothetical protein B1T46_07560 [Mycobacterium kansasii]POX94401.1 hypothetical protein C3473_13065 [Mycobacterium kansasii]VAZ79007.1 hypothetical protein LAUMK7_04604 [Mycobacterium kansasii]VAZ99801.1 hypothetical protein LAUMK35_04456 [Mycobacterium pseudokansasii]